jgi:hypothetical protein
MPGHDGVKKSENEERIAKETHERVRSQGRHGRRSSLVRLEG